MQGFPGRAPRTTRARPGHLKLAAAVSATPPHDAGGAPGQDPGTAWADSQHPKARNSTDFTFETP